VPPGTFCDLKDDPNQFPCDGKTAFCRRQADGGANVMVYSVFKFQGNERASGDRQEWCCPLCRPAKPGELNNVPNECFDAHAHETCNNG
jgi:hypothetical protein